MWMKYFERIAASITSHNSKKCSLPFPGILNTFLVGFVIMLSQLHKYIQKECWLPNRVGMNDLLIKP